MDYFVVIVLLALGGFCWLLAAGERRGDRKGDGAEDPSASAETPWIGRAGALRHAPSRLRAAAPGFVAMAFGSVALQLLSVRSADNVVIIIVALLLALAFAWVALRMLREHVTYVPGRGLHVRDWRGQRWMPFERIAHIALVSGRWRRDDRLARLVIRLDDGSTVVLSESLEGFDALVARIMNDAPDGVVETDDN